jgi:glycosyltransferase involved in cell wall biosynthesis
MRAWKFIAFAWLSSWEAMRRDYDLIFTTSTPLTAALPGVAARLLRGKPFIFEVRDLWPELPKAMGLRNPIALGGMHVLEWLGYKTATRIVTLAPGIADGVARLNIPRGRIEVVPNGSDCELFDQVPPLRPHLLFPDKINPDDFVAIYAGAHGLANGLDAVLDAAIVLKRNRRRDIKIVLIGDGAEKSSLMAVANSHHLENVVFQRSIPKQQLIGLLKGANLGLQILSNIPAFYRGTSPNKLFDYLAASVPVLINYPGWLSNILVDERCGIAVSPCNSELFADRLAWAADNRGAVQEMGQRARALAEREFARDSLSKRFIDLIESAVRNE